MSLNVLFLKTYVERRESQNIITRAISEETGNLWVHIFIKSVLESKALVILLQLHNL